MRRSSGLGVVALFATMLALPGALAAGIGPNVDEFVALHDSAASVSVGDCYLQAESQLSICALLARAERDESSTVGWRSGNACEQQVETALPERMLRRLNCDLGDLAWSRPLEIELDNDPFEQQEGDTQTVHVRTRLGEQRS